MSEPATSQEALSNFLRNLRQSWDDVNVTQAQLARALGASAALVSSWESAGAVPPEDRLRQYARFFCSHRSIESKPPALIPAEDLTPDEEREREDLINKLVRLREEALHRPPNVRRETGVLGGRFWHFPDGQALTILCTPFSREQLLGPGHEDDEINASYAPMRQYGLNPTHPNWIRNLTNGDIDALVELVGHVRAENPTLEIGWGYSDQASVNALAGNVAILGSGDAFFAGKQATGRMQSYLEQVELPIKVEDFKGGDPEFDFQFVVTEDEEGNPDPRGERRDIYRPSFVRDETKPDRPWLFVRGAPQLVHDVALIAKRPNPLNATASVITCTGLFSRGTYGAVRAFTDATFRTRNEQYVSADLNMNNFWLLAKVPVISGELTGTPDLQRPSNRLRTS